jgi:hypothetical protein
MSSIVIAGDTSGSVTLQAPAVSGSTVLNLPATSGTIQASGAGYTTNGVAYATSATGLVTGSALTFDGTNFLLASGGLLDIDSTNAAVAMRIRQTTVGAGTEFAQGQLHEVLFGLRQAQKVCASPQQGWVLVQVVLVIHFM